jgi:Glycosyl transferase family 11
MICTRLEGGLGNQLFQYAAGRALAHRHGTELLLDTSGLTTHTKRVTPRGLELHRFKHGARVAELSECLPSWLRYVPALSRWISPWRMYVERPQALNSQFVALPDQTYLRGYWQSHHYFKDVAATLSRELEPTLPLSLQSVVVELQVDAAQASSVAVHVRRGDYVSLASAASFHGALPLSYYTTALERVYSSVEAARVFVFSDDTDWCQKNLPLQEREAIFVSHNGGADAWQDLVLMSRCRHHVIANSSFSWWGAWLADQRWLGSPRLVVAPSRWFAGSVTQNLADRFPKHWTVC